MHLEIQVALNFVISYLYNKLPRRRVNILGEELDKALKEKFQGHWYPDKPFKGSAFRCLKTGDPIDPVLERAAQESGIPVQDVLENLPAELAVWIDPNEVSYRIGEKGAIKILYSDHGDSLEDTNDREVTKTFNPEAQCFRPIESVSSSLSNLSLSPKSVSPYNDGGSPTPPFAKPASPVANSSAAAFISRANQPPLTFTTATFAQTKFGSTKLKTSSKRANRMSPTEFSNYIKQRALQQQIQQSKAFINTGFNQNARPRSLSPNPQLEDFFPPSNNSFFTRSIFDNTAGNLGDLTSTGNQQSKFPFSDSLSQTFYPNPTSNNSLGDPKPLLEGLNFGLNSMPYPSNQYQHLLVAN